MEEYQFYQDQLVQAKAKGINSIAVSVEFLSYALKEIEKLREKLKDF